jgi:uncharacterized protein (DUF3084 family)
MFDWFKSKKKLIKEKDRYKYLCEQAHEGDIFNSTYFGSRQQFEDKIANYKERLRVLDNQVKIREAIIQDKNQRIAELQDMLIRVQKDKLQYNEEPYEEKNKYL